MQSQAISSKFSSQQSRVQVSVYFRASFIDIYVLKHFFNHDPYKHKRSPHFLLSLRTLRGIHRVRFYFK